MAEEIKSAVPLMGRILMSSVFLIFGVLKITTFGYYVQLAAGHGMPFPAASIVAAATLEIAGGLAILTGLQVKLVSWILFVYLIPTSIIFHNYWALQGALRAAMEAHFFKNMAIMGGLLFLATSGAGPFSLDAARAAKS
jgi:putative oxidoreductase